MPRTCPATTRGVAEAVAARDRALIRRRDLTEQITRQREALGAAVVERTTAQNELDELKRGDGAARHALAVAEAAKARLEAELASASDERVVRNLQALTQSRWPETWPARPGPPPPSASKPRACECCREAMAKATTAAAALEQARPLVADDPTDLLVVRRAELAAAESAAGEADPDRDSSPVNRRLADLERRRVGSPGAPARGPGRPVGQPGLRSARSRRN